MEQSVLEKAEKIDQCLAKRVRDIRKQASLSQEKLAAISGVSYGSIKRFESSGQISLLSLTKIALALGMDDELAHLFVQMIYRDEDDTISEITDCG